jgi:hypothetical protein
MLQKASAVIPNDERSILRMGVRLALTPVESDPNKATQLIFHKVLERFYPGQAWLPVFTVLYRWNREIGLPESNRMKHILSVDDETQKITFSIVERLGQIAYDSLTNTKNKTQALGQIGAAAIPADVSLDRLLQNGRSNISRSLWLFKHNEELLFNKNALRLAKFVNRLLDQAWEGGLTNERKALLASACGLAYGNGKPQAAKSADTFAPYKRITGIIERLNDFNIAPDSLLAKAVIGSIVAYEGRRVLHSHADKNTALLDLEKWTKSEVEALFLFQPEGIAEGFQVLLSATALEVNKTIKGRENKSVESFPKNVWHSIVKRVLFDTISDAVISDVAALGELITTVSLICPRIIANKSLRESIDRHPSLREALQPIRYFFLRKFFPEEVGEGAFKNFLNKPFALSAAKVFEESMQKFNSAVQSLLSGNSLSDQEMNVINKINSFADELRQTAFAQPSLFDES